AKIGGEMVSLSVVEQQVRQFVDDEAEMVAVNVPDEKKGEQIVLLTTADIGIDRLREQLLGANCNPLTIPTCVHKVDAVPKLGSGKTDFATAKSTAIAGALAD
ncbi:MAG: hypothetical protein KDI88_07480, partial [Gammaproteobacteria bacterium]|nr:hypothetical protein [Gammaproteobacteria bacterium]